MARSTLDLRSWAALRFEVALDEQVRRKTQSFRSQFCENWFFWRLVCTLGSARRLWSLEQLSDHLKCAEFEVAAALRALQCMRLVIVATTSSGRVAYALSPSAGTSRRVFAMEG